MSQEPIASDYHRRFERAWAEISPRLVRYLRSLGATVEASEDVLQDAALRALERRVPLRDADDLSRWIATVAKRRHIDIQRCRAIHGEPLHDVEDLRVDVAAVVVQRQAALVALGQLSERDRDVLFAQSEYEIYDKQAANRNAVARLRARIRLMAALDG